MSVLHVVNKDTKFNVAVFMDGERREKVWEASHGSWVTMYVGYPDTVLLDQRSQFPSTELHGLLPAASIKARNVGVESHITLGETERYHAYLRNVYERVRSEHQILHKK